MTSIPRHHRVSRLSPEKKALLERWQQGKLAQEISMQQILPREIQEDAPLSFEQRRLWFLDQLEPGSSGYNIPLAVQIDGALDSSVLERSLQEIIQRHEILRTVFALVADEPRQIIFSFQPLSLPLIDLQALSAEEKKREVERVLLEEARTSFDLSRGPLFRYRLLRLEPQQHIFLATFQHIICDGWSVDILFREMLELYTAFSRQELPQLAPLPIQYADFATWQHKHFQAGNFQKQLMYWKQRLDGISSSLTWLTRRHEEHPEPSAPVAHLELELSSALTVKLRALSQQENTTLFITLLAVIQVLLYRLTKQQKVSLGTSMAGRKHKQVENLIGFFVNTLVLYAQLDTQATFQDILHQAHKLCLEAYAHQDIPFEQLVEQLQPERDLHHNPFFDIMVNFRKVYTPPSVSSGLTLTALPLTESVAKFPLSLYIEEQEHIISVFVTYQPDLFSEERVALILEHFHTLLEQIVTTPEKCIQDYLLVQPHTRSLLPDPSAPIIEPSYPLITDSFSSWVMKQPDQPAICQAGRITTYRDLSLAAHNLACQLLSRNIQRGDVVAIHGRRSPELIAAILGVLLSGGVMLLLDPDLPEQRQRRMLKEAQTSDVIHIGTWQQEDQWLQETIGLRVLQVFCETLDREILQITRPDGSLLPPLLPDDACYIFFTSGTTGQPKGVLGQHKGLSHFMQWQGETFSVRPTDRCAQLTSLSFDAVLRDVFLPLVHGATICLPTEDDLSTSEQLLAWLDREQITLLHTVPTRLQTWLSVVPSGISLQSLRWLFLSGEPLSANLVRHWRATFPLARQIVNFYGPTETTMIKCFYIVPPDEELYSGIQPGGQAQPETQVLIFTETQQLCGIGELGEIVLRTPFRTRGYINAPEAQKRAFRRNPYRNEEQDLLYYTGDWGRYYPDGSLEILGRQDRQIKLRGVRVELDEIMALLSQHPDVYSCAVVAVQPSEGEVTLGAYIVQAAGSKLTGAILRAFLADYLPSMMLPSLWMFLEELPLMMNGKLDYQRLPSFKDRQHSARDEIAAARTPIEALLTDIWQDILGNDAVSRDDNFFAVGGHSLLAMQVIARVRRFLKVPVSLRTFLAQPTIVELARHIEQAHRQNLSEQLPPLVSIARESFLPLSYAQQQIWLLHQLDAHNSRYTIPLTLRLSGSLQIDVLRRSLQEVVRRHEILRTTFTIVAGQPKQSIHAPEFFLFEEQDFSDTAEPERIQKVQRAIEGIAYQLFDLQHTPPLRTTLFHLSETDHVLLLSIHHISFDAWSADILLNEWASCYNALIQGASPDLPDLPVQYADFAAWQRQCLQQSTLVHEIDYWKQQLAGITHELPLPANHPQPVVSSQRGARQHILLPLPLLEALKRLGQQEGVTLFMTLLAAFQTLLFRYSGQADIVVGTPLANRSQPELESLIGCFVNTLVLRTDLSGNPTFQALLQRVRDVTLDAYAHQDVPFEYLVEALQPERSQTSSPLFNVLFVLHNTPLSTPHLEGLTIEPWDVPGRGARFDLSLDIGETSEGLMVMLNYSTDLFEAQTIERLLAHFQTLLQNIVAEPTQSIELLSLLEPDEREQLLESRNNTWTSYSPDQTLPELFEIQARQTPNRVAIEFENQQITYHELLVRVHQLAYTLRAAGVGPEVRVGIYMERSLEMLIGLLGTLEAGGTYIPLDPMYPSERLAFMLQDAQVAVLLTQRGLLAHQPPHQAAVICVHLDEDYFAGPSPSDLTSTIGGEHLAYIIYTSGSTGRPKGVQISHRALVNFLISMRQKPGLSANDRLLAVTTLSFDIAGLELFLPLITGASLILASRQIAADGLLLARKLVESKATVMQATPVTWRMLLEAGWQPERPLKILCGGEAFPRDLLEDLLARSSSLWNLYGPTETTIWSTCQLVQKTGRAQISIGEPLANTTVYILDPHFQPVPLGVQGELYIGGDGLSRGYLHRSDLTAERFIPHPFSTRPGERLYRTGDLARYRLSGELELLRRIDQQVKLRGYRIEPGEIEIALTQHPAIRQAVVLVREDKPGLQQLVAYVIAEEEQMPSGLDLRTYLLESLPPYMVPPVFIKLDTFPLTPNGKVHRAALPSPTQEQQNLFLESNQLPPRTEMEQILAHIWQELLGIERASISSNFFELGGHSLLAVQMHARLQEVLKVQISLVDLFTYPTIKSLASFISSKQKPEPAVSLAPETTRTDLRKASLARQQLHHRRQQKHRKGV